VSGGHSVVARPAVHLASPRIRLLAPVFTRPATGRLGIEPGGRPVRCRHEGAVVRYQSRLIAVPMWSASHPAWAVAVWTLCVAAAALVGGFGPGTGLAVHTALDGPPALLLAALLVCGTIGAAVVLTVIAAGTGLAAVGLYSAVQPASGTANGPLVGGAAAGLAVVYAAALLRRFRAERVNSPRYAARVTISTSGGIVVAAGLIVVLPAALLAGRSAAAVAALVATGTALCAAGTVIPALLAWYGGPARARPNRVASLVGRLSVRHPASLLTLAAVLLAVAVAALRILGIPFLATVPALITLPVPVLLLAGRMRAATVTGSARGPAIDWAVRSTAPTTVVAVAGAGCVLAVADLAAGVAVLVVSVLVVLAVPALLALVGGSAQPGVSGPSVPPATLDSCEDGDDGGGVPWRK
jgi:hypothetical protein